MKSKLVGQQTDHVRIFFMPTAKRHATRRAKQTGLHEISAKIDISVYLAPLSIFGTTMADPSRFHFVHAFETITTTVSHLSPECGVDAKSSAQGWHLCLAPDCCDLHEEDSGTRKAQGPQGRCHGAFFLIQKAAVLGLSGRWLAVSNLQGLPAAVQMCLA